MNSLIPSQPTVYDLIQVAQKLAHGQSWTTPIARDVFDEALKDIKRAAGRTWRENPKGSDVYRVWNWIHPSAQSEMLGYTQRYSVAILQQREATQQMHRQRSKVFSYVSPVI